MLRSLNDLAAYYAPYGWFVAVWAVPLIALCAAAVAHRGSGPPHADAAALPVADALRPSPALLTAAAALAVFLCAYAYLVFYHEDLVGQDYALITGRQFATVLIWPEAGRFIPLAFQEYSVLSLLGTSAVLFHSWSILELCVVLACVYRLLDSTPAWFRCLVMMFMMSLTSFVYSYFGLVYTERDLVFWLAIWLACIQSFVRTGSRAAFCGALIAAQFALYYKETAFVLIGGFAGSRLLLSGWRNAHLRQGQYARFVTDHAMEIGQLALCAVFLLTYLIAIAPRVTASYAVHAGSLGAAAAALQNYVTSDPLLDALALAFVWRLVMLVRAKQAPDPFWEPLAAAGLAFAMGYVKLGLVREHYLVPTDVIAVLYLARHGYDVLRVQRRLAITAVVFVLAWVLQRNVSESAYYVLSRKEYVDGNVRLASFLKAYSMSQGNPELTLFAPQVGGFHVMEFAAFLRTKGWRPVNGPVSDSSDGAAFVIKSAHRYPDDVCYPHHDFRCLYAPAPRTGELVILFPGRHVPARELEDLKARAKELFHYRAEPTVIERALRALVPEDRMADRETDGYVFTYYSPP